MTDLTLHWFAAGAIIIGALVSIFRPDNTLCPINLTPAQRASLAALLGAAQACLQAISTGTPGWQAVLTALASVATVILSHTSTATKLPAAGEGASK